MSEEGMRFKNVRNGTRTNRNGSDHAETPTDRLPPHSDEAERAVIGSILLSPLDALPTCISRVGQDLTAFYDLRHQMIYEILVQMYDLQETIDIVTLVDWMKLQGKLEQVGGMPYLAGLPEASPSAASVSAYLDILMENHKKRQLIRICTETVVGVYGNADETQDLADHASQDIFNLTAGAITDEEEPMSTMVLRAIDRIEEAHQNQGLVTGLGTGFVDFDKMTTGMHGGEMLVFAGRPGQGKTSIAMNIAEHVAVDLHLPVGVFSLEMTRDSLVMRMLCSRARVNFRSIANGFLAERDMPRLTSAAANLHHAPIFINDISGMSVLGLRTRARRMHRLHAIQLLVIDYLQLLSADRNKNDSRQTEVSAISGGIKGLAKELNIPIIVLSQLNRNIENDKNRAPRLTDLRESGAIEQDADLVAFLYRPKGDQDRDEEHEQCIPVNLKIAKQRNGPTGDIPLVFLKHITRFESAVKASTNDQQHEPQAYNQPYADPDPQQEFPITPEHADA